MNAMKQATSLQHEDTIYSADSVEFCRDRPDVFVCGTYQVDQEKADDDIETGDSTKDLEKDTAHGPAFKRRGRALVYRLAEDQRSFKEIQRFEGPAILDMKWSPVSAESGPSRVAIANAEGQVTLHRWTSPEPSAQLEQEQVVQVTEDSTLVLSLDWEPHVASSGLITSLSDGHLAHLRQQTDGSLDVDSAWRAHDYEPWIAAWDRWRPDTVWSGGDDLRLKCWDVRATDMPVATNKRFDGGVTTIASSLYKENILAVGSYDEHLRIFDTRNIGQALLSIPTGGGIWRTKWHPSSSRPDHLLLACMHGGAKVVRLGRAGDPDEEYAITSDFQEHGSIAYGADWGQAVDGAGESTVATCSFYDHQLHLWRG